jgi:DHA1 family multidrug resistance protein-like MFS transporter
VGAGAAEVASLAVISGAVALERRGRAFGSIYAAQLSGMAIGPFAGSIAGVGAMNGIFVGACVAACAAAVPVAGNRLLAEDDARLARVASAAGHPHMGLPQLNPALVGSLMAGAAFGLTVGVYEACWTLLLDLRHAHDWQIGLSWTLFAVPFVIMARPGGWLADHLDRRWLAMGSLCVSVGLCMLYPFLASLAWLLALGAIEATGTAIALPSAQSLLTQASDVSEVGRVQGMYSTAQTAAIAVAASAGGALFGVAAWAPFVAGGAAAACLTLSLPLAWRHVQGHAAMVAGSSRDTDVLAGGQIIRAEQA